MIYTGPIDEYFDYRFGKLPYRSLRVPVTRRTTRASFQPAPVINYPNDYAYTRITEFKYLTGQEHAKTTHRLRVSRRPRATRTTRCRARRTRRCTSSYKALADATPDVHFVGRLATYKYYNMDQVVAQALAEFERIMGRREPRTNGHSVVVPKDLVIAR